MASGQKLSSYPIADVASCARYQIITMVLHKVFLSLFLLSFKFQSGIS